MTVRLHHVFIITEPGAPAADRLVALGMAEGSSNTHPGQGTANRRFFFEDMGLELIYFTDESEARTGPGRVIGSLDRYQSPDGSPFGLVFRARNRSDVDSFPGFPYQPVYFDDGQYFVVGNNAEDLVEPSVVLMPDNLPSRPPQILSQDPFRYVSDVRVSVPGAEYSQALKHASRIDRVTIASAPSQLLEITFGHGTSQQASDLRPDLPLVIRW
jgi:hypothetical protein